MLTGTAKTAAIVVGTVVGGAILDRGAKRFYGWSPVEAAGRQAKAALDAVREFTTGGGSNANSSVLTTELDRMAAQEGLKKAMESKVGKQLVADYDKLYEQEFEALQKRLAEAADAKKKADAERDLSPEERSQLRDIIHDVHADA